MYVVACNAKRNATNITAVRENFKAAGLWLSRGLSKALGMRCPIEKIRISDRRREEKKSQGLGPKKGAHDGTRTHVGMSKRLDLHSKERESTEPSSYACNRAHKSYIYHRMELIGSPEAGRTQVGSQRGYKTRSEKRGESTGARRQGG
jgi:hypothetical protein